MIASRSVNNIKNFNKNIYLNIDKYNKSTYKLLNNNSTFKILNNDFIKLNYNIKFYEMSESHSAKPYIRILDKIN